MAKDPREYGYEGEMAMSQLKGIMNHAKQMHDMLEPSTDLPEWVQSKITLAYDYMQTAADYMATEMNEEVDRAAKNRKIAQKAGSKLPVDLDTKTPDHFTAAYRRKRGLPEETQIDELSKDTVKSYLSKAGSGKQYPNSQAFRSSMLSQDVAKAKLGRKSSHKAKVMASEEVKDLDELSKDTMQSYNKKAFTQYTNMTHGPTNWNKQADKVRDKAAQRMRGMNMADRKLKKEEVAVNAAGAGNVAGLGVGPQGEPGVHMKKKKKTVIASFKRFTKA